MYRAPKLPSFLSAELRDFITQALVKVSRATD